MNIIEGKSSQVDVSNIDHEKLKSFQAKCTIWDFYDMAKEEYINKLPIGKQDLIISYKKWYKVCFCYLLSGNKPRSWSVFLVSGFI